MRWKAAAFLAIALSACGGLDPAESAANAKEVERLFDDALEPPAVGITLGSYEDRADGTFAPRARLAEVIYRAQVTDLLPIAADGVAGGWLVELTASDVIRGGSLVPAVLEVEAPAGSPTALLVGNFRSSFERAHLLVFARRYTRPNDRFRWHVHTVADTAEAREMLERAAP